MEPEQVGDIDLSAMFPGVENHAIRYVFHVCGLTEIAAQTRLIDFEGIDEVEDLANYTDREIDQMADRNAKRNPANQRVQFGLKRTKYLKAVCHWVRKNVREGAPCDVRELTPALIAELIQDMIAKASQKDSDSKLYYPEAFSATDYKNWIKKVENYLDSRIEGATWFEKVKDGDGRAAHLLLREHYVGEAHDMRRAAAANAKLESLFWKSEASFSFEKYLTRLNEAFKELEDAGQALWEAQKVTHLLKGIQNDDIQVQTTIGIVQNSFLSDFDGACLTLSRTISSRFASVEANRQKRRIGAVESRAGNRSGRGRARGRGGRGGRGSGRDGGRSMRVIMNGVDVTDISRNFTSDECEKLRACGGHTYVTQRREYLSGRYGAKNDNRSGGRGGRGARGSQGRNDSNQPTNAASASTRNVSATNNTNTTEIVEFDTSTSTIASQASASTRGGQSGGRFGPRRSD
ncbi:hypothetical protein MHU86_15266 [Fragilaria crotonensis]|nr:hypothetical protein MHU86_15266 [Fragilaria crotonensis]